MYSCLIGSDRKSASNVRTFEADFAENAISLTFDSSSTSGFEESDVLKKRKIKTFKKVLETFRVSQKFTVGLLAGSPEIRLSLQI